MWGLGSRVQGSGFRVQGSGFRVQGPWFRVPFNVQHRAVYPCATGPEQVFRVIQGSGSRVRQSVDDSGFMLSVTACAVHPCATGPKVWGSGFGVWERGRNGGVLRSSSRSLPLPPQQVR